MALVKPCMQEENHVHIVENKMHWSKKYNHPPRWSQKKSYQLFKKSFIWKQRSSSSAGVNLRYSVSTGCIIILMEARTPFNMHTLWLCWCHVPHIPFSCCSNKMCCLDVGASSRSRTPAIYQPETERKKRSTSFKIGYFTGTPGSSNVLLH